MNTLTFLLILAALTGNPAQHLQTAQQKKSIESLTDVSGEGQFYTMDYTADYKLQQFIDGSITSQNELKRAAAKILLAIPSHKGGDLDIGCSAFRTVSPEGDILYCRNFDYRFDDGATIMMRTTPQDGYSSMCMATMNFIGMNCKLLNDGKTDLSMLAAAPLMQMDGMNEKGFAISVLSLSKCRQAAQQYEPGKPSVMTSVMMRMLLDRCASVDEALELLSGYNFFSDGTQSEKEEGKRTNYHFLLSDASGKAVVVEYIRPDGPSGSAPWKMNTIDTAMVTNHYLSEGWNTSEGKDKRLGRIDGVVREKGNVMTEAEAMRLLDYVHQAKTEEKYSNTQWSVVYNLTKGTALVCINHDYSRSYRFSLKHFRKYRKYDCLQAR